MSSWENILRTDGVSDAELTKRYKSTALFATLCSVLRSDNLGRIIEPNEALMIPQKEEIASRWPGMSAEQVEGVIGDYSSEQDTLGELDLADVFTRVQELAVQAIELEEDQ